ncbi:efflux RND transporter periplasmic adaptor subunit [Alteromonas sp. RKMC-009]|uniref:efflux RND transporter periplasmic adaptor subunit n=1 Tax=Alteromonas sp. RKMC-009 TaxID=2267264 RepID=UPI000E68BA8C|nr:efflux RND transporter periplasmic adaptor subunit [Alteromonas sp. RKMC-009]AYA62772.1 efflux RND transporter periplasmic adaptor subunit [Alteromonas sp. RKMC-009]
MKREFTSIALLCLLALAGCSEPSSEKYQPRMAVNVAAVKVSAQPFTVFYDLPARVVALRTAEIRPQVSGIITGRLFEQGTTVEKGQPLFQIEAAPFRAEVNTAKAALARSEAALALAENQLKRLNELKQSGSVSVQSVDEAFYQRDQLKAEVQQAQATLERRQLDLDFTVIKAPIAGRVDEELVSVGGLVTALGTTPLAIIRQVDDVYVDVRQKASLLSEMRTAINQLKKTQNSPASISISDSNGNLLSENGSLLFTSMKVNENSGDLLIRLQADNADQTLIPGMFVRASIPSQYYENALLIPQQAVVRSMGNTQIWMVDADGQASLQTVDLGSLKDGHYLVHSGLKPGDEIVVSGGDKLQEGMSVSVSPAEDTSLVSRVKQGKQ